MYARLRPLDRAEPLANYTHSPNPRRVSDPNEANPEKWHPGDPFGPASDPDL
jgi:hypothetical protein